MTTAHRQWDGHALGEGGISLIVLTAGGPAPGAFSTPLLAAAAGDGGAYVVKPADLGRFLLAQAGAHMACHDAGELHLVLDDHFGVTGEAAARDALRRLVRDGRLVDVGLLEQLLLLTRAGYERPGGSRCRDSRRSTPTRRYGETLSLGAFSWGRGQRTPTWLPKPPAAPTTCSGSFSPSTNRVVGAAACPPTPRRRRGTASSPWRCR